MFNTKINLADLKESNINQLVDADMLMIRGGCGRGRRSRSKKCGGRSFSKKSFNRKRGGGCGTPKPGPVPPPPYTQP